MTVKLCHFFSAAAHVWRIKCRIAFDASPRVRFASTTRASQRHSAPHTDFCIHRATSLFSTCICDTLSAHLPIAPANDRWLQTLTALDATMRMCRSSLACSSHLAYARTHRSLAHLNKILRPFAALFLIVAHNLRQRQNAPVTEYLIHRFEIFSHAFQRCRL